MNSRGPGISPRARTRKEPADGRSVARMLEDIVGCKWSLRVLGLIEQGVARPGEMRRRTPGLSAKVLNERLRKLLRYSLIGREVYAEVPPHVEYRLTAFGRRFGRLLAEIRTLEAELPDRLSASRPRPARGPGGTRRP
jgi:DNA-binding HxlR family transcriptional regulator